jgi:thioredoxin-like negative regulator of GroEL
MKRRKKTPRQPASNKPLKAASITGNASRPAKANSFARMRPWLALIAVLAAGAWYLVSEVTATIAEHDLSRIGNGVPAVVQIHDPRCASCVALQHEARDAMDEFDDGELQYLVADINNDEGRTLATAHGVGNVTLLLFDGKGERRRILSGPNTSDILVHYFRVHRDRYGARR